MRIFLLLFLLKAVFSSSAHRVTVARPVGLLLIVLSSVPTEPLSITTVDSGVLPSTVTLTTEQISTTSVNTISLPSTSIVATEPMSTSTMGSIKLLTTFIVATEPLSTTNVDASVLPSTSIVTTEPVSTTIMDISILPSTSTARIGPLSTTTVDSGVLPFTTTVTTEPLTTPSVNSAVDFPTSTMKSELNLTTSAANTATIVIPTESSVAVSTTNDTRITATSSGSFTKPSHSIIQTSTNLPKTATPNATLASIPPPEPPSGLSGGEKAAISVCSALAGIALVACVIVIFVKKPCCKTGVSPESGNEHENLFRLQDHEKNKKTGHPEADKEKV